MPEINILSPMASLLSVRPFSLSISLAMMGTGAPGVWFSFVRDRERWLRPLLLAAALLVPAGVIAIIQATHRIGDAAILFCLVALLPAVLALGGAVCVLLLEARGPAIGRMYAFDLLGACGAKPDVRCC